MLRYYSIYYLTSYVSALAAPLFLNIKFVSIDARSTLLTGPYVRATWIITH
jgi:hypothetical protein